MLVLLACVTLFLGVRGASDVQSILSHGYPAEAHEVTTQDGYILSVQRIPHGKTSGASKSPRKVVFLNHGVFGGSNSFTYLGPEYGIAYNLADADFDVWMGNARGNSYSRRHVSLDPDTDKEKFFDFSYEEIALYDLPAMVDYVLAATKQNSLHYVGYSQGGAVFFVLNSMNTTYNSKFASANLLTGIGYQTDFPNTQVKLLSNSIDQIYSLSLQASYVEFNQFYNITPVFLDNLVSGTSPVELVVGASVKQVVHYSQNFRDKSFARWNYGAKGNLLKYGKPTPPSYDLSKINVNVTMHYSLGDKTQSQADLHAMVNAMPKAKTHKIARDTFTHLDYLISKDVKELVTNYVIEDINDS